MKQARGSGQVGKEATTDSPSTEPSHGAPSSQPVPPINPPDPPLTLSPLFSLKASKPQKISPKASKPQNAPKMPIPRLRKNNKDRASKRASLASDKNRVVHACEPCRDRKIKCSGVRPSCQHCIERKRFCEYADGKRDKTRR